ncbi:MAG: hypothetical protein WB676_26840 [Bryobacteraceae bacterium]
MKLVVISSAAMLLSMPVISTLVLRSGRQPAAVAASASPNALQSSSDDTQQPVARLNACSPPNHLYSSIEETAWRIWIAATCPVNQSEYPYVVWENWIEQSQFYPLNPATVLKVPNTVAQESSAAHMLHASTLTLAKNPGLSTMVPGLLGAPNQNCNGSKTPPPNQPNLVLCEEVRENGATEDYIAGTNLWNRNGQEQAASADRDIQFPKTSVEIKADWILLSSIDLECNKLPSGFTQSIHVETINGNCYALAGMHLISKLTKNWIWATFEAQFPTTNPNRCKALGCSDSFGSNPAETHGASTQLTSRLANLMASAKLAPEWKNYRLDGVQIFFTDDQKPTLLGNSIIEGENAGVPLTESSCISCHAVSSVSTDGTDGIKFITTVNPVGEPEPLPSSDWIRRDFVWSLFNACPAGASFQNCNP